MKRLWLVGLVLLLVGLFCTFYVLSLSLLYDSTCHLQWDELPVCIELRKTQIRWLFAPLPGNLIIAYSIVRAIKRRRARRVKPPPTDAYSYRHVG